MTDRPYFVGVDWGTSALRCWLLTAKGDVLAEQRSHEGMSRLEPTAFASVLSHHLARLAAPATLPVLMCGMVGSRQGWREAPYADCPAGMTGLVDRAIVVPDERRDIRILPGLAQRDPTAPDVMRGEETKLLGLSQDGEHSGLVCMPGTHTKWALIEHGAVTRFRTTMAGELFAVLAEHSLLRLNLGTAKLVTEPDAPGFQLGLADGLNDPAALTSRLFQLRASSLLFARQDNEIADRLSGLMIGVAIADGLKVAPGHIDIALIADGTLADLYQAGLIMAGCSVRAVEADRLTRAGLTIAARQLWPS
jgi:2-dehydro-3-deoxygalactonokinase